MEKLRHRPGPRRGLGKMRRSVEPAAFAVKANLED